MMGPWCARDSAFRNAGAVTAAGEPLDGCAIGRDDTLLIADHHTTEGNG